MPRTNLIYLQFIDWTISNNFDHFQSFKRHHLLRWTFWFRSSSIESKWKCSIDFRFFISLIFVPMISVIIFSLSFHLFVCFILWSSMARVCFLACFSLGSQTTTHSNIACCDGARQLTVFFLLYFCSSITFLCLTSFRCDAIFRLFPFFFSSDSKISFEGIRAISIEWNIHFFIFCVELSSSSFSSLIQPKE